MPPVLHAFLHPAMPRFSRHELLRAALGAGLGILVAAGLTGLVALWQPGLLRLVAPLGASAVLIFAVPNGPLSQPLTSVGGNGISALAVLGLGLLLPQPLLVLLAVPVSLALMMALRVLHPPGAAVALLLALEAQSVPPGVLEAGRALASVLVLTGVLVLAGSLWAAISGRRYPFRQAAPAPSGPAEPESGLAPEALEAILQRFNQSTNLGAADLGRMLAAAEAEIWHHRFDERLCGAIMSSPVASLPATAPLPAMLEAFTARKVKAMPVVDAEGRMIGFVDRGDLLTALPRDGWRWPFRKTGAPTAAELLSPEFTSVAPDTPVGQLLRDLARHETQAVAVLEAGRPVGVITRTDLLRLMLEPLPAG